MTRRYLISVSFFGRQKRLILGTSMTDFTGTGVLRSQHIESVVQSMKAAWCGRFGHDPSGVFYQVNCCDFLGEE